jgi:AcrR family transcriptional regulator
MAPTRRHRGEDGPTRTALLDAAETVMVNEGYAAVTTRRISAEAGVNNGLVSYYFGTMDQMFVELFRRAANRDITTIDVAVSHQPLWELWESIRDFADNALMTEFTALANHRDAIRTEIKNYSERGRRSLIAHITRALEGHDSGVLGMSPEAFAVLMVGVSRFTQMESAFGLDIGHHALQVWIEQQISTVEGRRRR